MPIPDSHGVDSVAMLADLPQPVRQFLASVCSAQSFEAGELIFRQGEQPQQLHLLVSGRVALVATGAANETVVEVFERGEAFLLPAVLLDRAYLVSARTISAGHLLTLPRRSFRRLMDEEADFARAAARQLARQWRVLVRQVKDLKLRAGLQRLAAYLLTLDADAQGRVILGMDRSLLAQRLGMTAEHLSRSFAQLRPLGVAGRGRALRIGNRDALRKLCDFDPLV